MSEEISEILIQRRMFTASSPNENASRCGGDRRRSSANDHAGVRGASEGATTGKGITPLRTTPVRRGGTFTARGVAAVGATLKRAKSL